MSSYSQAISARERARPAENGIRVSPIAAAMVPSLGAAIFAVALVHVLFLSAGTRTLFRDSDAGWHIRNGEAILSSKSMPSADPFSFVNPGREWFAWEWASDVMLGAAHRWAGPAGVALLVALVIALTTWGAYRVAVSLGGNLFLAAIGSALLLGATSMHWLARPHVFSWLLSLIVVAVAERERTSKTGTRALRWLPLLSCAWANLHGSFLLGPGILFVYAVGEFIRALWERLSPCPGEQAKSLFHWRLTAAGVASLAATFINPYGWKLHAHIISYLRDSYLMDHIAEFRSFSFHAPGAIYVELFLAAAIMGIVALIRQRAFGPALLGIILLHFSLYSARYFPQAAVLLLPLSAVALTRELENIPRLRRFLEYSGRVLAIDRRVHGAVPAILVVALTVAALLPLARAGRVGFDPDKFPVRAGDYLEQRGLDRRVFAKDQWGGYLIYRFDGRLKVFIDGRSDYYGPEAMQTYAKVMDVKPGWDGVLEQFGIQSVLTTPDHALTAVLALSPQWKRVYADSTAVIFERID